MAQPKRRALMLIKHNSDNAAPPVQRHKRTDIHTHVLVFLHSEEAILETIVWDHYLERMIRCVSCNNRVISAVCGQTLIKKNTLSQYSNIQIAKKQTFNKIRGLNCKMG